MTTSVEPRTYMEDADDDGNPIDDTRTYVSVVPPGMKEAANVSRTRNRTLTRGSSSSSPNPTHLHTDSDSTTQPSSPLRHDSRKPKTKSRDKDRPSSKKTVTHAPVRPSPKSSKTLPNLHTSATRRAQEQAPFYGISPTATSPILTTAATSSRPRAYTANQRPNSYYGQPSKPPPSNARYWQHSNPILGTSFPPQAPYPPPSAPQFHSPFPAPPPPQLVPSPVDYLTSQDALAARFDPHRPRSAMGRHVIDYSPEYDDHDEGGVIIRRPSLSRRKSTRQDPDRIRMPPPPRPSTMRPQSSSSFAPPAAKRQSVGSVGSLFDDESLDGDDSLYSGVSPAERYHRSNRRPSIDSTTMYDMGHGYAEVAGRISRRNSHYGGRRQSTEREVEDKYKSALQYQEDVDGPTNSLTADTLRRINKTPSKSIKSSGSKGESGYGRAASRNSMDPDDMTIFVKGMGSLTIGGAQLDIRDGAEIAIRTNGSERNSRGGSDNASSAYADDSRTARFDRPQGRVRPGSRAGSHSRGFAHHPAAPPPPHPQVDYYGNPYMPMAHAPYSPYPYNI